MVTVEYQFSYELLKPLFLEPFVGILSKMIFFPLQHGGKTFFNHEKYQI